MSERASERVSCLYVRVVEVVGNPLNLVFGCCSSVFLLHRGFGPKVRFWGYFSGITSSVVDEVC